jgi:Domain of unknown function (DUF4365)
VGVSGQLDQVDSGGGLDYTQESTEYEATRRYPRLITEPRRVEMRSKDDIGNRGESIFCVRITQPCGPKLEPLFRAFFLGEKKTTLDFMVELVGLSNRSAYFFVQVKTTVKGVRAQSTTLSVKVKKRDVDRMVNYPGPTYIVGIDEVNEQAYIVSANLTVKADLPSIPISHPLDRANLAKLWKEVDDYWTSRDMTLKISNFAI